MGRKRAGAGSARGRKARLAGRAAGSRWGGESEASRLDWRGNGGLAMALARGPLDERAVARALARGGRFDWEGAGPGLMPLRLSLEALDRREARGVRAPGRERGRMSARQRLWGMMRARGVDFTALDGAGRGFELWALGQARRGRRSGEEGLRLWREMGLSPDRLGPLVESAVAEGALRQADLLEAVWPRECSRERLRSALGRAVEIIHARWGEGAGRARALELAAGWMLERAPEAIGGGGELSRALVESGLHELARAAARQEGERRAEAERSELGLAAGRGALWEGARAL